MSGVLGDEAANYEADELAFLQALIQDGFDQGIFKEILGRPVDLVTYGGLKPMIDADIRAEAVLL